MPQTSIFRPGMGPVQFTPTSALPLIRLTEGSSQPAHGGQADAAGEFLLYPALAVVSRCAGGDRFAVMRAPKDLVERGIDAIVAGLLEAAIDQFEFVGAYQPPTAILPGSLWPSTVSL